MTSPDSLPDGKELGDDLDAFFRGGGNFEDIPPQQELPGGYIETFFSGISSAAVRIADRRSATDQIRSYFPNWKHRTIQGLNSESLIRILEDLTLKDMAQYAKQQFDLWSKEAGRAIPNSKEYSEARDKSNYWAIMDEVVGPASDPDK